MRSFRVPPFAITLAEQGPERIQLFRVGSFHHPEHGQFKITPQLLAELKKNFEAKVRGIDIAIDYRHENEDIAAGWIKNLELTDEALFAEVDWTPKGKQVTSDKEFRYISPEFTFEYQDNETLKKHGPVLLGAALTNRPVIKRMEPVALSEGDYQPKGDAMSPEEMMKMIEQLKAENEALKKQVGQMDAEKQKYAEEKKMAEKKSAFQKMMSEGKACAAQEKAYLDGDMDEFVKLAKPLNLSETGTQIQKKEEVVGDIDDQIVALAEKKRQENKSMDLSEAYQAVLRENPELRTKKYASH